MYENAAAAAVVVVAAAARAEACDYDKTVCCSTATRRKDTFILT